MALDIEASHFKIMLLKHSKVNCIGSFNVSNHVNNNNDNSCDNNRNINYYINDDINNNSNHDINNNNSSNSSNNTKIKTNGIINNNSSSSGSKCEFTESEHIDRNNNNGNNNDQKSVASEIFVAATESDISVREPWMKVVQNQSNLPMQEVKILPNKIPTSQQHNKASLFNASSTRLESALDDVFNDSDDVFDDGSQENSHVTTSGNRCSNNATLPCKPLTLRRPNGTTLQLPPLQRLCGLPCKEGGQLLDLQFRMMAEFNEKRFAGVVQRFCPDSK